MLRFASLALGLIVVTTACTPARVPRRESGWRPKTLSLAGIRERSRFTPLWPTRLPAGYELRAAQIVWIVRSPSRPELPPRQAVRFVFKAEGSRHEFSIIEARHLHGFNAEENLMLPIGEGYFDLQTRPGMSFDFGTRRDVDFCIMSDKLSEREVGKTAVSLSPMSPPIPVPR